MWLPKDKQPAADYNVYGTVEEVGGYIRSEVAESDRSDVRSIGFKDEKANSRIQASLCFEGKAFGLVVRGKPGKNSGLDRTTMAPFCSGYEPDPEIRPDFLNSGRELCESLFRLIFPRGEPTKGLLIVAGATNSMKTNIANGLIHLYLEKRMEEWWTEKNARKPHLVTFEDPIETWLVEWDRIEREPVRAKGGWSGSPQWRSWLQFPDYTPRLKGTDIKDLDQAVSDALRQTPTVFYSTETRSHHDWPKLFKLAESHLVITTTHSSSIAATFNGLVRGLEISTAPQRSEMANVILGVVHLRPDMAIISDEPRALGYNLPCLWRRTAYGTKAFAAEGMSSLIPAYVESLDAATEQDFFLGRQTFARILADRALATKRSYQMYKFRKSTADRELWIMRYCKASGGWNTTFDWINQVSVPELHTALRSATEGEQIRAQIIETAAALDLRGE